MDIASLSMGMSQDALQNKVDISIMKMSMDDSKTESNQITKMIDNMAINENLGKKLDVTV